MSGVLKLESLNYCVGKPRNCRGLFLLILYCNVTDRQTDREDETFERFLEELTCGKNVTRVNVAARYSDNS